MCYCMHRFCYFYNIHSCQLLILTKLNLGVLVEHFESLWIIVCWISFHYTEEFLLFWLPSLARILRKQSIVSSNMKGMITILSLSELLDSGADWGNYRCVRLFLQCRMASRGGWFGTTVLLVGCLEAPPLLAIIHFCDIKGKVVKIKNVPRRLWIFRHTDFIKIQRMNFDNLVNTHKPDGKKTLSSESERGALCLFKLMLLLCCSPASILSCEHSNITDWLYKIFFKS